MNIIFYPHDDHLFYKTITLLKSSTKQRKRQFFFFFFLFVLITFQQHFYGYSKDDDDNNSSSSSSIRGTGSGNSNSVLVQAIRDQDIDRVKAILRNEEEAEGKKNLNKSYEDDRGYTPLIEAVLTGNIAMVRLLIAWGKEHDVGAFSSQPPNNNYRHTPLRAACLTGNVALVRLLLENGADPNAKSEGDRTPLMGACYLRPGVPKQRSFPIVKLLLTDQSTDPMILNSFRETALDLCITNNYSESIDYLKKHLSTTTK